MMKMFVIYHVYHLWQILSTFSAADIEDIFSYSLFSFKDIYRSRTLRKSVGYILFALVQTKYNPLTFSMFYFCKYPFLYEK